MNNFRKQNMLLNRPPNNLYLLQSLIWDQLLFGLAVYLKLFAMLYMANAHTKNYHRFFLIIYKNANTVQINCQE